MSKAKSTSINDAIDEIKSLKAKQRDVAQGVIDGLRPLIKSTKYISQISWTQYTPFFNDGDACEFRVNDVELRLSDEGAAALNNRGVHTKYYKAGDWDVDNDYDPGTINEAIEKSADVLNYEDFVELQKIVKEIDDINTFIHEAEDAMKDAFGDHTRVVVTAKGIETEEYEHD